jgi:hypothetical protein
LRFHTAWVKTGKAQCEHMFSAVALIADIAQRSQHVRFVPIGDSCTAAPTDLFDHIVSLGEQRGRDGEAERIRGLAIYDEFEFGRLLNGQVGGLSALQDLIHKSGSAPEKIDEVRALGHQTPLVRELAKAIHGWDAATGSQGHDPGPMRHSEGVIQCDEGLSVASRRSSGLFHSVAVQRSGVMVAIPFLAASSIPPDMIFGKERY